AATERWRGGDHFRLPEELDGQCHAADVDDAVDGAHLVEVDRLERDVVDLRLRAPDDLEHRAGPRLRPGPHRARLDALEDLAQTPMHVGDLGGDLDVEVHAGDRLPHRARHFESPAVESEGAQPLLQRARVHTQVEHGGEEHVAGDAAHRLEVEDGAHRPLPILATLRETSAA